MTINRRRAGLFYCSLLISFICPNPQDQYIAETYILSQLDYESILASYRIVGTRSCRLGKLLVICPVIENIFPVGIFEVTRDSTKGGGLFFNSHTPNAAYGSNLHYAEAHIYTWVPPNPFKLAISSPLPQLRRANFFTESAGEHWKNASLSKPVGAKNRLVICEEEWKNNPALCAGRWGSYYPITGYFSHYQPAVASVMQALRAARGANESFQGTKSIYQYQPRTGHYIQIIKPQRTRALRIGIDDIERVLPAEDGYYVIVHYGIFRSCPPCSFTAELQPARTQ